MARVGEVRVGSLCGVAVRVVSAARLLDDEAVDAAARVVDLGHFAHGGRLEELCGSAQEFVEKGLLTSQLRRAV